MRERRRTERHLLHLSCTHIISHTLSIWINSQSKGTQIRHTHFSFKHWGGTCWKANNTWPSVLLVLHVQYEVSKFPADDWLWAWKRTATDGIWAPANQVLFSHTRYASSRPATSESRFARSVRELEEPPIVWKHICQRICDCNGFLFFIHCPGDCFCRRESMQRPWMPIFVCSLFWHWRRYSCTGMMKHYPYTHDMMQHMNEHTVL